jgi:hypothetical protein
MAAKFDEVRREECFHENVYSLNNLYANGLPSFCLGSHQI